MVRLLILVCSLHVHADGACHRIDPMYAAMPPLVCTMRQMALAEQWAEQNPGLPLAPQRSLHHMPCLRNFGERNQSTWARFHTTVPTVPGHQ